MKYLYCLAAISEEALTAGLLAVFGVEGRVVPMSATHQIIPLQLWAGDTVGRSGVVEQGPRPGVFAQLLTAEPLSRDQLVALTEPGIDLNDGANWPGFVDAVERVTAVPPAPDEPDAADIEGAPV